jgi:hypothetical protein
MKNSATAKILAALAIGASQLAAQIPVPPSTVAALPQTINPGAGQIPTQDSPPAVLPAKAFPASISLGLAWNESYRTGITVPINNPFQKAIEILGVQTSANLFVTDFPKTIGANGTGSMVLIYFSRFNSTGDSDSVRILTDSGEVDIPVAHARAAAYQLSAQRLSWNVGDAVAAKTVTVTFAANTTVPLAAAAMGTQNSVSVLPQGGGVYLISVTPASTASPEAFPAIVTLNPALPGGPIVIGCSVVASN